MLVKSNHPKPIGGTARRKGYWTKLGRDVINQRYLYLLLSVGFVWYIVYRYLPMAGLIIAFKDFSFGKGIFGSDWVGLKYFRLIFFNHADFWNILRNTVLINLYKLLFSFPVPVLIAIMLNEVRSLRYKKFVQSAIYLPYFVSWVIFGGIITQFLSPSTGIVNMLLGVFGVKPIFFLAEPQWFRSIVVSTDIWKTMGWGSIIYLAAITGIDPTLYEAATIDGCNRLKKTWYITLPSISQTVVIMLLLNIGRLLEVGFEQIYVLYNPVVYGVGDVISTYVYRIGVGKSRFSLTTAIGLFQSAVGLVLITTANFTSRRLFDKSIW